MSLGDWPILTLEEATRLQKLAKASGKGRPVAGHPRRCQGRERRTGDQCTFWARKGSFYCKLHGGNIRRRGRTSIHLMSNPYIVRSSATLRQLVEAAAKDGRLDSLEDEIAIARALADRCIKVYDEVCFGEKKDTFDDAQRQIAGTAVRAALRQVSELMGNHAKIRALGDSTFSVQQVDEIVMRMQRIMAAHLDTNGTIDARTAHRAILHDIETMQVTKKDDRKKVVISVS